MMPFRYTSSLCPRILVCFLIDCFQMVISYYTDAPCSCISLTDNITRIVPAITRITNTSLDEGVMPKSLKHAIVRPLLKKPSLDKDTLSSYRPVNNLTQLSKVIEKVVALRIMMHVSDQHMVECFQTAYRKNHSTESTETALLYVTIAVKTAMNKKRNHLASCGLQSGLRYDQP